MVMGRVKILGIDLNQRRRDLQHSLSIHVCGAQHLFEDFRPRYVLNKYYVRFFAGSRRALQCAIAKMGGELTVQLALGMYVRTLACFVYSAHNSQNRYRAAALLNAHKA